MPIPTTAASTIPFEEFTIPSVRIPQTFFPQQKISFTHFIEQLAPNNFFMARQTPTAEVTVNIAGFFMPPSFTTEKLKYASVKDGE